MPEISLRPLQVSDEPFLWEMLYQALYVPEGQPPFSRDILAEPDIACYVRGWGRLGDWGLRACDSDKPVGAIWLRLWAGTERGYGFVDETVPEMSIAVLKEYRGFGLGTRLIREVIRIARPQVPGISLSVVESSPARRLYERLGFRTIGRVGGSLIMLLSWAENG